MVKARDNTIEIELVYALPHEQITENLRVPAGTVAGQAIERSLLLLRHPEIAGESPAIGIFGRRVAATQVLREFDRIEIYRPLIADPKQARRTRARRTVRLKG